ncbi:hypothetical protein QAD02_008931 [Eretmocerus hayati]|uniref:Uncharacterized protein n=1 Tax=Eretmocerus hayati TaxID=131215 RepID=A0ACC2N7T7_9HYME|nr:hypothetical protein QAD02_008931 [Eretmocerus hayati]
MAQSSSASGTSSRRHLREHNVSSPGSPRYADSEWEVKEFQTLLHKELEEAKARAAQMEKTMRWWSDCTANWREKWCEVRDERNKARKEAKVLKVKLEIAVKDLNTYKHESQELELQNTQLKREMEKVHMFLSKHAGQLDQKLISFLETDSQLKSALGIDDILDLHNNTDRSGSLTPASSKKEFSRSKSPPKDSLDRQNSSDKDAEDSLQDRNVPKDCGDSQRISSPSTHEKRLSQIETTSDEVLLQKMSMLNLKLEETTKTLKAEKEEKSSLHRVVKKLRGEVAHLTQKCEKLQNSRSEAIKELLEMKSRCEEGSHSSQADSIDEMNEREGLDHRLSELQQELERLQSENAAEWGKRERLETEKISLERENKQLRSELRELQESSTRRPRPISGCGAVGIALDANAQLEHELLERGKELAKLRKQIAERTTELSHASRRYEQYESEVRRVRGRVDELKRELAAVQDELDAANEANRRLLRHNELLQEQIGETGTVATAPVDDDGELDR